MFTGDDTEIGLELFVPTLLAIIISWILIHKRRHMLVGILAGQGVIFLLLAVFWTYIEQQIGRFDPYSPERDIFSEGYQLQFGVGSIVLLCDAAFHLLASVLLVTRYRRNASRTGGHQTTTI